MATLATPELLLLDEHTAALDPKSADQVIRLTEEVIHRDNLTTLMVTHSMHQAAYLGDRLIMMVRGKVIHDIRGADKQRLTPEDLLDRSDEVRRAELLDESAAEMLERQYVRLRRIQLDCGVPRASYCSVKLRIRGDRPWGFPMPRRTMRIPQESP